MPRFRCHVITEQGKEISLVRSAVSAEILRKQVETDGSILLSWQLEKSIITRERVSSRDLFIFTRELYILLKSGMTILEAVRLLGQQVSNNGLKLCLAEIDHDLQQGVGFSDSLARHQTIFSDFYVSSIRAGEKSGTIVNILERLGEHEQRVYRLKEKMLRIFSYPVILILVSLGVIAFMLFYVVPVFDLVFRDMKVDLPLTTKAILSISAAIKGHLIHFSILGFLLIVFFIFARRSEEFTKRILDIISRLPFIGSLIRKFRIARFSATLSMLLAGGIPVLEAMRIVASGVREKTQIVGMNKIITALHQGNELSQALHQSELVDAMAIQMVGVGEKSGDLPVMLEAVAEIYEEEMDHDIEIATAMVEPILLLVMGGVIALIVVSIFIPVIQLSSAF